MGSGVTNLAPAPVSDHRQRHRFLTTRYVVIAAIGLAAIVALVALIHYRRGGERRRYETSLQSTLDRLVTAQEGFYYDSTRYTASLQALPTVRLPDGVHVRLFSPDRRSWWAIATHDLLPARECIVWVGVPAPAVPAEARAPEDETRPLCFDSARLTVKQSSPS